MIPKYSQKLNIFKRECVPGQHPMVFSEASQWPNLVIPLIFAELHESKQKQGQTCLGFFRSLKNLNPIKEFVGNSHTSAPPKTSTELDVYGLTGGSNQRTNNLKA